MELSPREIADGLARFPGVSGRCEVKRTEEFSMIDDLADSTLASTVAAMEYLRRLSATGKRHLVCGDLEGPAVDVDWLTKQVGESVVIRGGADWLFACGEQAASIIAAARTAGMPHGRTIRCESVTEATNLLQGMLEHDDVVLVKGKQTSELRALVDALTQPSAKRFAA